MATRLKTVRYKIPTLASLPDNSLTALTTITAYIPEFSGTVTFKSVVFTASVKDGATMTTGNYSSRRLDVSVGGATATSYTNANLLTGSGENETLFYKCDATSHFVSNWTSGTNKTVAVSILVDVTHATIVMVDVDVDFYITYEYDDTQTTQIKTVYLPLSAPVSTVSSSKPGVANAVIPALDTALPETSKTIRSMYILAQGNINNTASTTDSTISMQVETYTTATSSTLEMSATSDYWTRFFDLLLYYNSSGTLTSKGMDTSVTRNFYIWGSVARFNHPQVYMVITYEFDASASSECFNSVMIPAQAGQIIGGTTSSDFQRISTELWIEEPTTITSKEIAFYSFWEQAAPIAGLNMRVGTGSFITYTDGASVMCGGNGTMCRNDGAFTLARGKNTINFDIYRTDTADFGWGLTGFWILNYTSAKPTNGYGAANHTIFWGTSLQFGAATATNAKCTALATTIPETDYFINAYGCELLCFPNTTGVLYGLGLFMEKTNAEGQWYNALTTPGHTDAEQGLHIFYSCVCPTMYRWASDPNSSLLDPEATRRWWFNFSSAGTGFCALDIIFTYHTNTFTLSGTVSNYADADGAGLTVRYYNTSGTYIGTSTTTTGGAHTKTWYDNTIPVFAECYEDSTHTGSSIEDTA